MAKILGCMAMSHGPQLLTPPEKWPNLPTRVKPPFHPKPGIELELTSEVMEQNSKRCNDALATLRDKLAEWNPDTIVIVGDDQNENLKRDNMPPFTIFLSDEVDATLRYRYEGEKETDQMTHYQVDSTLANVLIEELMASGFDPSWSRETRYPAGLGHAFGRVLKFVLPRPPLPPFATTNSSFSNLKSNNSVLLSSSNNWVPIGTLKYKFLPLFPLLFLLIPS